MQLNISSDKINDININKIADFFMKNHIETNITKVLSTVKCGQTMNVENGLQIMFFESSSNIMKSIIWPYLRDLLDLECAYIKYRDEYVGCILDWPNVFIKSNCPSSLGRISYV